MSLEALARARPRPGRAQIESPSPELLVAISRVINLRLPLAFPYCPHLESDMKVCKSYTKPVPLPT